MKHGEIRLSLTAAVTTVLGAASLYPLFTTGRWFLTSLGAVTVVCGVALLARRSGLPHILVPVAAFGGLLCFLTASFAGTHAFLGFVPGPQALRALGDIAGRGFTDIGRYAAPVPAFAGITLVTASGIGLVAVLVDVLAVRIRRAALAGLPILAIFSVTSAILADGAGWLPFVFAAAGFSLLLLTDARHRVAGWGRRVTPHDRQSRSARAADTNALAGAGRRIGLVALGVAVVVPVAIPDLPSTAGVSGWLPGLGGQGKRGMAGIRAPDPFVSLKRELQLPVDSTVLRYETKDPQPDYLRLYALDRFDGRDWSMSSLQRRRTRELTDERLPAPQGLSDVRAREVRTRITIDRNVRGLSFLPLPYPPRKVGIRGEWRFEKNTLMVYSTSDVAGGRTYEVTSWEVRPSRERLRSAPAPPPHIAQRYLRLPDDLPELVGKLATRVTRDADNRLETAINLQDWFTGSGNFTYSLEVEPSSSSSALRSFLRERVGYCQQFASAMAVMARYLGIPARVAVGYTAGTISGEDTWVVSAHDAHAWPELYFHGVGWVRFEPTPSVSGQATAITPEYAQPQPDVITGGGTDTATGQTETDSAEASAAPDDAARRERFEQRLGIANETGGPAGDETDGGIPGWLLIAIAAAILVACVPAGIRELTRRRRWWVAGDRVGRAHAAWGDLRDDARDLGVPGGAGDSPRRFARRIEERYTLDDPAREALGRITRAEERARYARTPAESETLRGDARTVRKALTAAAAWPRRLLARTVPPSTLRVPRRIGGWIADGLEWADKLDTVVPRLRGAMQRRRVQ